MEYDYKRFCLRCGWHDEDYGCTSPPHEEIWQCPMYIYYHPEEVKQFENDMKEWIKQREEKVK